VQQEVVGTIVPVRWLPVGNAAVAMRLFTLSSQYCIDFHT
jgi:hypothetical protein